MRAIAANEGRYPISAQCRLLGVARSTYYSMRSRADRPDAPDPAAPAVVAAHAASKGRYGSRVNVNVFLPNRANYFCPIAPAHDVQPHQCKLPNSGYSSFIFLSVGTSLSL